MFKVLTQDGNVLAYTEQFRYIRVGSNGSLVESTKEDAIGIAINGQAYSNEVLCIVEIDGGQLIATLTAELQKQTDAQTMTELAIAEIAEMQINDQTANELALAELADIVLGG